MARRADVELRFTAKDLGGKTLTEIADAIDRISDQQVELSSDTEIAERSLKSFAQEASNLSAIVNTLEKRLKTLDTFREQGAAVEDFTDKLEKARTRFDRLSKELTEAESPTDEFKASVKATGAEVKSLEAQLKKAERAVESAGNKLRGFGVDPQDIGALTKFGDDLAAGINKANTALEKNQSTLRDQEIIQGRVAQRSIEYARLFDEIAAKEAAVAAQRKADDEAARIAEQNAKIKEQNDLLFKQQAAQAKRTVQQSEYARLFDEIDAKEARQAQRQREIAELDAFKQTGVDAAKAATEIDKAATAVDRFALRQRNASRQAVGGILNPDASQAALIDRLNDTLAETAPRLDEITKAAQRGEKATEPLNSELRTLDAAAKKLTGLAELNDRLAKQSAELDRTRTRYQAARAEVQQYARQVAEATTPNAELSRALDTAQQRLERLAPLYRRQAEALLKTRQEARAAGLSVKDLTANEKALIATAERLTQAQNEVAASAQKLGIEVKRSGGSFDLFNSKGRTTLSLTQRIRGQILSLAAAYIGLYGAINEVSRIIDTSIQFEGIRARLNLAVDGDTRALGEELQFVERVADELGLQFLQLADSYSKFRTSTALANIPADQTREIFEDTAKAARVLRLTNEQVEGTFKALEQVFSKGKIQAEEIRGQLAERLPGALAILAKGLEATPAQIDEALQKGLLTAENLLVLADEYERRTRLELPAAQRAFDASFNRLQSSIDKVRLALGSSGFLGELANAADATTDFFNSDEGKEFVTDLGGALRSLGQIIAGLARRIGVVVEVIKTIAVFTVLRYVGALAGAISGLGASMLAAGPAAARFARGLTVLGVALRGLTGVALIFFGAFQFGKFLRESSVEVRAFGSSLVAGLVTLIDSVKIVFDELGTLFFDRGKELGAELINGLLDYIKAIPGALLPDALKNAVDEYVPQKRLLDAGINALKIDDPNPESNAAADAARRIFDRVRENAERRQLEFLDAFDADETERRQRANTSRTSTPELPTPEESSAEFDALFEQLRSQFAAVVNGSEEGTAKRQQALEEFARESLRIEKDLVEAQEDSLEKRLKLIDLEFIARQKALDELEAGLRKEGNTDEADQVKVLRSQLEVMREISREAAKRAFAEAELGRLQDQIDTKLEQRADRIEEINAARASGSLSQAEASERINAILADSDPLIEQLIDKAIKLAEVFDKDAVPALEKLRTGLRRTTPELTELQQQAAGIVSNNIVSGIDSIAESLGGLANGTKTVGDVFKSLGQTVRSVISDILIQLARAIIQSIIFKRVQDAIAAGSNAAGGGYGAIFSAAINAFVAHDGAVIGAGGSAGGQRRSAPASWFAGAPRYHSGTVVGLKPDEVPAILQTGEEVLSRSDPRNVRNGGASAGGGAAQPANIKVINAIDSSSVVKEGLATPSGERAILNIVRANRSAFRQALA